MSCNGSRGDSGRKHQKRLLNLILVPDPIHGHHVSICSHCSGGGTSISSRQKPIVHQAKQSVWGRDAAFSTETLRFTGGEGGRESTGERLEAHGIAHQCCTLL